MPGTLFVVATPIGNLDDSTARALRVLRDVSVIAAEDTRRTARLLARYAIATPTTSLHEHNERQKTPALLERLRRGETVAIVSDAGTPTVSDPGRHLISEALDAGIRVEPIPGPSAALAALAISGFATDSFTFLGFPPVRPKDRKLWLGKLKALQGTVIFFEAPHRIASTLEQIQSLIGDCPALVARELTKAHEESVKGPISKAVSRLTSLKGEYTVVLDIGHITENIQPGLPEAGDVLAEFGVMTNNTGVGRREGIARLAAKYGRSTNEIYATIETAKKLSKA
jgi:16S rRNA (cytidine1402-2'-O)-methyltransferase